jgi:hypothetical protein
MHFKNNRVSPLKKVKVKASCPYHSKVSTINSEPDSNIKTHKKNAKSVDSLKS